MCLLLNQMDLVLRSIESTCCTVGDKDVAISLMAGIVERGCVGCNEKHCPKAMPILVEAACAAEDSLL
ncbi:hypothetical protein [Shewanella halifaxensis]|uniref:hypothetical protein n=1 Tax=Shewanella halifaxensis TaxID=271098 RepID=UPI0013A5FE3C|nr:hypothetical protein [Shewanella halifaxensis]